MIPIDPSYFKVTQSKSGESRADSTGKTRVPPNTEKDFSKVLEGGEEKDSQEGLEAKKKKTAVGPREKLVTEEELEEKSTSPLALFGSSQEKQIKIKLKPLVKEKLSDVRDDVIDLPDGDSDMAALRPVRGEKEEFVEWGTTEDEGLGYGKDQSKINKEGSKDVPPPPSGMPGVQQLSTIEQAGGVPAKGSGKTEKVTTRFHEEPPDLTQVNPNAVYHTIAAAPVVTDKQVVPDSGLVRANMKEIIDQITKEILTLEQNGKTDTIVVLQQPPLFRDARIVLTSFNTATGEFNLAFENLSAEAQRILASNLDNLKYTLQSKGYVAAIHVMTATTLIEHPVPGDAGTTRSRDEGSKERSEDQEKQRRGQQ